MTILYVLLSLSFSSFFFFIYLYHIRRISGFDARIYPPSIPVYTHIVEQKSRADFAPDIELPLSKLTATDNIMLGNHGQ
jgi:hypothetical protein